MTEPNDFPSSLNMMDTVKTRPRKQITMIDYNSDSSTERKANSPTKPKKISKKKTKTKEKPKKKKFKYSPEDEERIKKALLERDMDFARFMAPNEDDNDLSESDLDLSRLTEMKKTNKITESSIKKNSTLEGASVFEYDTEGEWVLRIENEVREKYKDELDNMREMSMSKDKNDEANAESVSKSCKMSDHSTSTSTNRKVNAPTKDKAKRKKVSKSTQKLSTKNKKKKKVPKCEVSCRHDALSIAQDREWLEINQKLLQNKEMRKQVPVGDTELIKDEDDDNINNVHKKEIFSEPSQQKPIYNRKMKSSVKKQKPMPESLLGADLDENCEEIEVSRKTMIKEKKQKANKHNGRDKEFRNKFKKLDSKVKLGSKDGQIYSENMRFESRPRKQPNKLDCSSSAPKINPFAKCHKNESISRRSEPKQGTSKVVAKPEETINRPEYPDIRTDRIETNEQDERNRSTIHDIIFSWNEIKCLLQYPYQWEERNSLTEGGEEQLKKFHERKAAQKPYEPEPIENRIKLVKESVDPEVEEDDEEYDVEAVLDHAINEVDNKEMVCIMWGLYWISLDDAKVDYQIALARYISEHRDVYDDLINRKAGMLKKIRTVIDDDDDDHNGNGQDQENYLERPIEPENETKPMTDIKAEDDHQNLIGDGSKSKMDINRIKKEEDRQRLSGDENAPETKIMIKQESEFGCFPAELKNNSEDQRMPDLVLELPLKIDKIRPREAQGIKRKEDQMKDSNKWKMNKLK